MQWSLIAVIHFVNALCSASYASAENGTGQISSVIEAFGYSPACVASALTSCESSSTKEPSVDVVDSIEGTKTLLQEMKSEGENSSSVVTTLLQEMKSEMKAVRLQVESERENSASVLKTLLQEIKSEIGNSGSEIKAVLQEMKSGFMHSISNLGVVVQEVKRELDNVSDHSQARDCVIPCGTTAIPEGKELPKNCADLKVLGDELSGGVQTVYPYFHYQIEATVICDQVTDGGGWTVIQSRSPLPIRENFTRNWDEYADGFGDPKGEFWIGLNNIHALTTSAQMELRIDLEDAEGEKRFAKYRTFHVGDATSKYVLTIGNYSGNARDGMTYPSDEEWNSNGMKFSSHDNDNDLYPYGNCAEAWKGGWWFNYCAAAHLNGLPIVGEAPYTQGIQWEPFRGWSHSMKKASMRIRPVSFGF